MVADTLTGRVAGARHAAVAAAKDGPMPQQLVELLEHANTYRVDQVDGRWVIDCDSWASIAVSAGLAVREVQPCGRVVLRLNTVGRTRLYRWRRAQQIARQLTAARHRREGFVAGQAIGRVARPPVVPPPAESQRNSVRRLAAGLVGVVLLLAVGALIGMATAHGL